MRVLVDANIFYSKTLTDWLFFLRRENPQTLTILCITNYSSPRGATLLHVEARL